MQETSDPYWRLRPQPATPSDDICPCVSPTPLLLQPHLSPNPLACARCNLEVPPERIGFDEGLAHALAYWLKLYDSLYFLWLDSGEFEEWAATQFRNPSSVVNSRGIELAEEVSKHRRCYLSWFQEEGDDARVPPTECPRCSGGLNVRFEGERAEGGSLVICEACSIAISV